jgi:MerR family transcriptional regulator, light-induced transcriptional regulator
MGEGVLRIGEVSKRTGVSPELLRAWERRYGLLSPTRSAGGLRLYSLADVDRVRLMQRHLGHGLSAAEAAGLASASADEAGATTAQSPEAMREELAGALDRFDEERAQLVFDRMLALLSVETLLADVLLPYLAELGDRWSRGDASVAQEHFASGLLRGRLLGLARGWGLGDGPLALLACLPGELHDLGLLAFGLALRGRGWRVVYLGPDAPIETVEDAAERLAPDIVVFHAVTPDRVLPAVDRLHALGASRRVALGGSAASTDGLDLGPVLALTGNPVAEAAALRRGEQ